jgi:hypothetical protein
MGFLTDGLQILPPLPGLSSYSRQGISLGRKYISLLVAFRTECILWGDCLSTKRCIPTECLNNTQFIPRRRGFAIRAIRRTEYKPVAMDLQSTAKQYKNL